MAPPCMNRWKFRFSAFLCIMFVTKYTLSIDTQPQNDYYFNKEQQEGVAKPDILNNIGIRAIFRLRKIARFDIKMCNTA